MSMRSRVVVGLLVATALTACTGGSSSDTALRQTWYLSAIATPDGQLLIDTPQPAFVQFDPEARGSDGCRLFTADSFEWADPQLTWWGITINVPATGQTHPCPDLADPAIEGMQMSIHDGVTVTVLTSEEMVWKHGEDVFTFHPAVDG